MAYAKEDMVRYSYEKGMVKKIKELMFQKKRQ